MISYETVHTIRELVEASGMEYHDEVVLRYIKDGQIAEETFKEFATQCRALTAWIACKSKEAGHPVRVAMMCANSPLYVKLFMGVMCGGGVSIPMDTQMKTETVCGCLNKAEADIYIYDDSIKADTAKIARDVSALREVMRLEKICKIMDDYADNTDKMAVTPKDCATIIFTSGTTGEEKGVMLSNGNLIDNIFCTKQAKKNVKLNILPMHHSFCITGDILLCFANCATLCMNGDAGRVVENLVLFEPNIVNMVPMVAQALYNRLIQLAKAEGKPPVELKSKVFGRRIEKIVAGGAHLPAELVGKYQELGIFLCQGYGMTECSPSISSPDLYRKDKAHTAGKVVFRCKTRVVDGELQVKSPSVMMGYVNAPELTAQAITEDGWLRTGDIGYEDEEGFLHIMGRKKNLIILSNGNNVSPEQIEKLLLDHQIINQALVYGEGNNIVAEIYPDPNYLKSMLPETDRLIQAIDTVVENINVTMPSYKKIMKHIIRKTPLMTTASGKIVRAQRAEAKDIINGGEENKKRMPENDIQKELWNIIAGIIGRTDFGTDTDIFDAGLDSFGAVSALALFDEQLGLKLELDKLLKTRTVLGLEAEYNKKSVKSANTDYGKRDIYPLNNVQKYFAYLLKGNTTANIPMLLKLGDEVDVDRLVKAVKELFKIHPVLNNVVQMIPGKGYANFRNDEKEPEIPVFKISFAQWEERKKTLVRPYLYTDNEPLYHIEIYQVMNEKYLFIDIAHIISDGVSLGILINDINRIYDGKKPEPEKYTFYEYLLDCEERERNHTIDELYQYFENLFKDARIDRTILNRPDYDDMSAPEQAILNGSLKSLDLNMLKDFCRNNSVSENTLFLTAFAYCVSIFQDRDEIVTTSINHGRTDSRFGKMVGCLFKTYNYRYTYDDRKSVVEMLHESGRQLLEIFSHHLDNYHADEIFFQYQGDILYFDEIAGAKARVISLPMDALPFHLSVLEGKENFIYELRYWKNRYDEEMLKIFLSVYENTLLQIVKGGDIKDINSYLPAELFPGKGREEVIGSRHENRQPYGAWGVLYVDGVSTEQTARIMPDGKVDLLKDSGRLVMLEGLKGRRFCDLEKLERTLRSYPGIKSAKCYLKMSDKLVWSVTAEVETKMTINEDTLEAYLERRLHPFIMPELLQKII